MSKQTNGYASVFNDISHNLMQICASMLLQRGRIWLKHHRIFSIFEYFRYYINSGIYLYQFSIKMPSILKLCRFLDTNLLGYLFVSKSFSVKCSILSYLYFFKEYIHIFDHIGININ